MTDLSITLMAHPKRERFVRELQDQLGEVPVAWDEKNDRWDTGRRALLAHLDQQPRSTWALTIQDDAVLCRDFLAGAYRVAEVAGTERPISLYIGAVRPYPRLVEPTVKRARAKGVPWIEMHGPWWGVAIILPTHHIEAVVAHGDQQHDIQNYDLRVADWYERNGIGCWYTSPSLVDHRGVEENPSLIEGRWANRQAHYFIGDRSPLDVDWEQPPMSICLQMAMAQSL